MLVELKKHDFKYREFVFVAVEDQTIRDILIRNIVEENHINIYYNSYHLVYEASKEYPELFYKYWEDLVPLLDHKISYLRSISHWILTNLIEVDKKNKFDKIKERYFSMIKDEKFLTGFLALKDMMIMSKFRTDLKPEIYEWFLKEELLSEYSEKQKKKFRSEIVKYLVEEEAPNQQAAAYLEKYADLIPKKKKMSA